MRILLGTDGLAGSDAATLWLDRFAPVEACALCITAISQPAPVACASSRLLGLHVVNTSWRESIEGVPVPDDLRAELASVERIRRLPLGSVAEHLLMHATCPILIART